MDAEDAWLRSAAHASPPLHLLLEQYADGTVADVLWRLPAAGPALQDAGDLAEVVERLAARSHPRRVASAAARELLRTRVAPTSNHYGVDTLADSVHGTLLSWLRHPPGERPGVVVVLGFGSISLNNLTFPRGLRLYDGGSRVQAPFPRRLPVLPTRLNRRMVGRAEGFDAEMVERARCRLDRMERDGELSGFASEAARSVLDRHFDRADVLAMRSYGHQAARINADLWARLFRPEVRAPVLVQLQVEEVATGLLVRDLESGTSLVSALLFSPGVRGRVLRALDGRRGCWSTEELRRRLRSGDRSEPRGGTHFFWGVDREGRRYPLLVEEVSGEASLVGLDGFGELHRFGLAPSVLLAALEAGSILPSMLTCFAALSFARGVVCLGGYYQAEYLPLMRDAVAGALAATPTGAGASRAVRAVPCDVLLAGMQCVGRAASPGVLLAMGPVEIAATGGWSEEDLGRMLGSGVRRAVGIALTELVPELVPGIPKDGTWLRSVGSEAFRADVGGAGAPRRAAAGGGGPCVYS